MKKLSVLILLAFIGTFISGKVISNSLPNIKSKENQKKEIPQNVLTVLENSCYGCHNSESRNEDAREDLSIDKWNEYKSLQKIGKLKDIQKVIEKGEMPPKQFLERFPDKKLIDKDAEILINWVKSELL